MKDIRFFLNQFRKGDINGPKYRQGLVDMLVNKIYLYDAKVTVLCITQDGHFYMDLKEISSLKCQLSRVDKKMQATPRIHRPSSAASPAKRIAAESEETSCPTKKPRRRRGFVSNRKFLSWWRWGGSNPRPKAL